MILYLKLVVEHNHLNQVDLAKQMVVEDETLEDVSIDELRDSLCEHEPRFPFFPPWCWPNIIGYGEGFIGKSR